MDQKRFIAFIVLSMSILIGWNIFVLPMMIPPPKEKGGEVENAAVDDNDRAIADKDKAAADEVPAKSGEPADETKPPEEQPAEAVVKAADIPKFPAQTVQLGSGEFSSGYRQLVTLTSHGAAVEEIVLNDPRYLTLTKPHQPLRVISPSELGPLTFELGVPQLTTNVGHVNWEVIETLPVEGPHSSVAFRIRIDELEIVKRYELPKINPEDAKRGEAAAYALNVELTFKNLRQKPRKFNYVLQGPTGVPLENVENTQKYRDVAAGFTTDGKSINHQLMTAAKIAKGEGEEWKNPVKYIGVDVQFFAALLVPGGDQWKDSYFQSLKQELVGPNKKERSDVSCRLASVDLQLAQAGGNEDSDQVVHTYQLFAGPKRDNVLPLGVDRIIDYGTFFGTFRIDWISRILLDALKLFHALTGSWGLAVICLTICVRGAMFPISIKQARSAAKMQEIQPELAALKEKYGNDKEKMARAQMELFRKHNHNPFAGCLPLFLQLPIFMGLYSALNHAVDLRLAGFLWIDNLAAPDMLWRMPVELPFLGQEFNLLPFITIVLFIVQQKMFMPPPTTDEQRTQQKFMNIMMVAMGVMFYKVPAGLCVYFIASSLWGLGERKLLPKAKPKIPTTVVPSEPDRNKRKRPDSDEDAAPENSGESGGLWNKLLKAAEKETEARRQGNRRK